MKRSLGAKTLLYPAPVWVVGSYGKEGKPNAMTIAWGGICCSKPPCVAVSIRKATYTYGNILEKKSFTINIPSEAQAAKADYFGMVSGRDNDKLAAAGVKAVKSTLVDAPYLEEFPLILECKLLQTVEIGLHTQFIGEILDVKADESVLNANGSPDIEKLKPFIFTPESRRYYKAGGFLGEAFAMGKAITKPE
ncbi:MAG: flavin reductase family protein [Actinomycetota bacterium]|nr:flavin reductase family protein [Actinomycetota bacterium]